MGLTTPQLVMMGAALAGTAYEATRKPPRPSPPPVMPDQTTTLQAQTLQESKDAALRYGRASTVLTNTGAANTTGDKLGP
jgi:hypothetical protein